MGVVQCLAGPSRGPVEGQTPRGGRAEESDGKTSELQDCVNLMQEREVSLQLRPSLTRLWSLAQHAACIGTFLLGINLGKVLACMYGRVYVCMYMCRSVCMCLYLCVCTHIHMCIHVGLCVYVCTCIGLYLCV